MKSYDTLWCGDWIERSSVRNISGPDDLPNQCACIILLPLGNNHLVPCLQTMGICGCVEFNSTVKRENVQGFESGFHLFRVNRVGIFNCFLQDESGHVSTCDMVGWFFAGGSVVCRCEIFAGRSIPGFAQCS